MVFAAAEAVEEREGRGPAGSEPMTMKMVAETTSAQPAMKPSAGCSARATHE